MSESSFHPQQVRIGIIGLGYVGLPLAVAFAEKYRVIGLDINASRVEELCRGIDSTLEVEQKDLLEVLMSPAATQAAGLCCTTNPQDLNDCNVYIVTVPTPTDRHNRPVLTPMIKASQSIGDVLKQGDVVIYESTVYPGVTEEEMVPILEQASGLRYNKDFFCGYSPERINPGDKEHTVTKILKVTSGSTPEVADFVDALYRSVIVAGTHRASSIRVAEAAKVIENSQRDINIAFVNELSKIFNRMGIDTQEVLEAAGTKWNFLKFKPGLVGGHCIGVDPYYLAQKAQEVGYHPEIILAGRRLNDSMGAYVAEELVKGMLKAGMGVKDSRCLVLGFTFKENCPDVRNTRVIDIIRELESYGMQVITHDPWVQSEEVAHEYGGLVVHSALPQETYDAVVLAVAHREFESLDLRALTPQGLVYDVKGLLPKGASDWRL
jgi:UDP-N-acetyl-D-glucosamine/UDP-N-acetyl-D-galactosamine dehydrogenase